MTIKLNDILLSISSLLFYVGILANYYSLLLAYNLEINPIFTLGVSIFSTHIFILSLWFIYGGRLSSRFLEYRERRILAHPIVSRKIQFYRNQEVDMRIKITNLQQEIEILKKIQESSLMWEKINRDRNSYIEQKINLFQLKQLPGFIYIMKRQDGIIKIGYSNDTDRRLRQHKLDYQADFELLYRFVVPDCITFERLALSMTSEFAYEEPGRSELRKMSDDEIEDFCDNFRRYAIVAISH